MSNEYPKMLYKHGGVARIEGDDYTQVIVESADEEAEATAEGFFTVWTAAQAATRAIEASEQTRMDAEAAAAAAKQAAKNQIAVDKAKVDLLKP